jgi:hypothetical protein
VVCVCITVAVCGCTSSSVSKGAPPPVPQGAPVRLVVLGDDEALGAGVGRAERNRSTWPQLLFREHLPVRASLVDLASPGATAVDVRDDQVPRALGLQPTIAVVWVDGESAVLTAALGSLKTAGATVLAVATPDQAAATQEAASEAGARVVPVPTDASQQAIADAVGATLGPVS